MTIAGGPTAAETVKPAATIWTAPVWACIDSTVPQSPGQPPPAG